MAKKKATTTAPSSLTMRLDAPGMTAMHRAGLGGLAATLRVMRRSEGISEDDYQLEPTSLTLNFGTPGNAGVFLKRLFEFAFGIESGIIRLPGTENSERKPPREVRARLQQGILLTFLQHGLTRKVAVDEITKQYPWDDKQIPYQYKECFSYTHQTAWKEWINNKGELVLKDYDVQGPVHPGAAVRHNAWSGQTKISQPLELVLPLYFAMVGTLSLPINRGTGVLIVPHVDDLQRFAKFRSYITPELVKGCFIGGTGDAALQFEIRCRAAKEGTRVESIGCDAIQFRPMPWATQQKSRSRVLSIDHVDGDIVDFYNEILSYFDPHVNTKKKEKKEGRGKTAITITTTENYVVDSVVRPFIADNIARGRLWFEGFARWLSSTEPTSGKPYWNKVGFERKGLHKMVENAKSWKQQGTPAGAEPLVLAVQESLRRRYGAITGDVSIPKTAVTNRLNGEYERWRLAFSGAKTAEQFRYSLTDMFSRARSSEPLQNCWREIVNLMVENWELARDLALVGLASYMKKDGDPEVLENPESADSE